MLVGKEKKKSLSLTQSSLVSPRHVGPFVDLISLLGSLQLSQVNSNKTEPLIFILNSTIIHPAAYTKNVGIILDTSVFLTHEENITDHDLLIIPVLSL